MVLFREERFMSIAHRYVIGMVAGSSTEKLMKILRSQCEEKAGHRWEMEIKWEGRENLSPTHVIVQLSHPALKAEGRRGDDDWLT